MLIADSLIARYTINILTANNIHTFRRQNISLNLSLEI